MLATLGVLVLGILLASTSAHAALTSPTAGGVYRGDVPFNEDTGGIVHSNLTPADVPNVTSLNTQTKLDLSAGGTFFGSQLGCSSKSTAASNATNPLKGLSLADTATQGNFTITRDADNVVVFTQNHLSNQDWLAAPTPDAAQPYGGTWLTAGMPAGFYTARSYKRDIRRGDPSAAVLATDTDAQKAAKRNALSTCRINGLTSVNDQLVSTVQFEYRPWEQRFKDVLQTAGGVDFNLNSSREFQITLRGGRQSTIKNAPSAFTVVKLPTDSALLLPPDPSVCASNPAACVPPTPPECSSNPSACTARFVMINYSGGEGDSMLGFFDLETRAFIASATVQGSTSILKSAGSADAQLLDLKSQLYAAAAAQGINAAQLSALTLSNVSGGTQTKLSLDEGLEQLASTGLMDGQTVRGGPAVNAGVLIHLILGTWRGTAAGPYTVSGMALTLPALAGLPALPALPAPATSYGPLVDNLVATGGLGVRQVHAAGYTGGQHIYALAAGIEPSTPKLVYIPTNTGTITDKSIDFVGVPLSITQGGTCTPAGVCAGLAILVGGGAAVYDNPLTLPPLLP